MEGVCYHKHGRCYQKHGRCYQKHGRCYHKDGRFYHKFTGSQTLFIDVARKFIGLYDSIDVISYSTKMTSDSSTLDCFSSLVTREEK